PPHLFAHAGATVTAFGTTTDTAVAMHFAQTMPHPAAPCASNSIARVPVPFLIRPPQFGHSRRAPALLVAFFMWSSRSQRARRAPVGAVAPPAVASEGPAASSGVVPAGFEPVALVDDLERALVFASIEPREHCLPRHVLAEEGAAARVAQAAPAPDGVGAADARGRDDGRERLHEVLRLAGQREPRSVDTHDGDALLVGAEH